MLVISGTTQLQVFNKGYQDEDLANKSTFCSFANSMCSICPPIRLGDAWHQIDFPSHRTSFVFMNNFPFAGTASKTLIMFLQQLMVPSILAKLIECEIEFTGICFFCKLTTTKRLVRASCTCKKSKLFALACSLVGSYFIVKPI